MGKHILTNANIYLGKWNIGSDLNAVAMSYGPELQDATTFGAGSRERRAGFKAVQVSVEGFVDPDEDKIDANLFNNLSVLDVPFSFSRAGVEGETAYSFLSVQSEYNPSGDVGSMFGFSASGENSGDDPLIRGTLLIKGAKTATGVGTAFEMGAVSSEQNLYAALHVFTADGTNPTLDVKVQSATDEAFTTPNDRITFSQKTAKSFEWATKIAGPITDTWWRIDYAITGTDPSFDFAVIAGIV